MSEAEQQENIRRPRANSLDRDQRAMRVFGDKRAKRDEVEPILRDRLRQRAHGAHFRQGKPAGAQLFVARRKHGLRSQRRQDGLDAFEDRIGARGRHLLGDDDSHEAGKAGFLSTQRRGAADFHQSADDLRIERAKPGGCFRQRLLAVDERARMIDDRGFRPPHDLALRRLARTAPGGAAWRAPLSAAFSL